MPAVLLSVVQALAVLAVLIGVGLALPLWGSLIVDGVLVLALAVAVERIVERRPSAPSDRRDGVEQPGVE
ncbi:hypothetical protein [Pseudonocardia sp. NPDC049154]|uniref:hypothetical protein n=1 Tax=Pseudonocardia sp. NPDC049154 TaxID=3155501 RepID=UPI0033E5124C